MTTPASQNPQFWETATGSEAETEELGRKLAISLKPGLVINLIGDLGAGKTRLVQAVAEGAGCDRLAVTSPTFVLHHQYQTETLELNHFDAYRLRDSDEFLEFGGHELLEPPAVSFVEWGDRILDLLPKDLLRIEIESTGKISRRFRFCSSGPVSEAVLKSLQSVQKNHAG